MPDHNAIPSPLAPSGAEAFLAPFSTQRCDVCSRCRTPFAWTPDKGDDDLILSGEFALVCDSCIDLFEAWAKSIASIVRWAEEGTT
jgi:hypothetical protein